MEVLKLTRDFINKSNLTNSSLDKIEVLKEYSQYPEMLRVFEYVYSPFKRFNITSSQCECKLHLEAPEGLYTNIFSILDDLNERNISGHTGIGVINGFVKENIEYKDVIYSILDKNLKTRSTASMINKIIPNCVPSFEVALAESYDAKTKKNFKLSDGYYRSRKLDGVRCVCIVNTKDVKFYSRTGIEFLTLTNIANEIKKLNLNDVVFDGEVCIIDDNGNENFNDVMTEIKRKDHTIKNVKYYIFDFLTIEEFTSQTSIRKFSDRQYALSDFFKSNLNLKHITRLEQFKVNSEEDIAEAIKEADDKNWEGIMLRKDSIYIGKRSSDILKVKKFTDAEYKVLDVELSKQRCIVDGLQVEELMLKSVIIEHEGYKVSVGSGFSIEQRRLYCQNPNLIIGKTITVQYFDVTTNKNGTKSLRFPTIKFIFDTDRDV